jgi:hypothetical protein
MPLPRSGNLELLRTAPLGVSMSAVLIAVACAIIGTVIGWVACNWHWHTRLAESWSQLRAATWRRRRRREPVGPQRALDVTDVTDAFSYGLVTETESDRGEHPQRHTTDAASETTPQRRTMVS